MKEFDRRGGNQDQSSRVQCVVDWFGPTDFISWDPAFNPKVYDMITRLLGVSAEKDKEKAGKASPLSYADKTRPPC